MLMLCGRWAGEKELELRPNEPWMSCRSRETGRKLLSCAPFALAALRGEASSPELGDMLRKLRGMAKSVVPYMETAIAGRRLARTGNNLLALVPRSADKKDQVVPGLVTPFVLRKRGGGGYELVGEAYVNGTIRRQMSRELKFERITLR